MGKNKDLFFEESFRLNQASRVRYASNILDSYVGNMPISDDKILY